MVLWPVKDTNPERIGTPVGTRVGLPKMVAHRSVLRFIDRVPDMLVESKAHRAFCLAYISWALAVLLTNATGELIDNISLRAVAWKAWPTRVTSLSSWASGLTKWGTNQFVSKFLIVFPCYPYVQTRLLYFIIDFAQKSLVLGKERKPSYARFLSALARADALSRRASLEVS